MDAALLLVIYTTIFCKLQWAHTSVVVEINGTQVEGRVVLYGEKIIQQYLGIPFAEPPVGSLRFQKPQPNCKYPPTAFSNPPACPQYTDRPYPWYINSTHKSEDCLYLNIWTPGDASQDNRKAVLYWIHGGGFRYGSIRDELYSGIPLASLGDIVVVTVNYRLNAFGFLTTNTEDAPANIGMYDILEGLKWVNQNIEAFGGDPQRITIAGENAGSLAVGYLTVSPLSQGLYRRLIMESSSPVVPMPGNSKNPVLAQKLAEKMGCASATRPMHLFPEEVMRCLRDIKEDDLSLAEFEIDPTPTMSFIPQWGDQLLPSSPAVAIRTGNFRCKDLLFGHNKNEGSLILTSTFPELYGFFGDKDNEVNQTLLQETMKLFLNSTFPSFSKGISSILGKISSLSGRQLYNLMGDLLVVCPDQYYGEKCAEQGTNVYSYLFTHRTSITPWAKWMGVAHYEEVQFVFGRPLLHPHDYEPSEVALSRQMIERWSNFVKFGKPDNLWPLFSRRSPQFKYLGPERVGNKTGRGPHRTTCNLLRIPFAAV